MTISSKQKTEKAKEHRCVSIGMEWEKWPKTKAGNLSLEIIMVQRRQLNSILPWSMSAVGGGIWVGFAFGA